MRYLAIDLGGRRTGLALGDDETGVVTPLGVVEARSDDPRRDAVARAVDAHGPDALVVGLPFNMDGTEGAAAKRARAFADALAEHTGLPVHVQDERLSSAAADDAMARTGLTHAGKKARRDALAAAVILRDFLDRRARDGDSNEAS